MKKQRLLLGWMKFAGAKLWTEWVRPTAVFATFVLPFKSAVADWNWVPTGSMKPTILEGDMVWVNKLAYDFKVPFTLQRLARWADPARGDVVVLFSPEDGTRLVKRVIAGPGDTLEMRGNVVFLNGTQLDYQIQAPESFRAEIYEDASPIIAKEQIGDASHWVMSLPNRPARRNFSKITLPKDQYFVMGDSRDNSKDSRFFGPVDRETIVGKAGRVLVSVDKNHSYTPRFSRFFSPMD
jgi:signal peptidase I